MFGGMTNRGCKWVRLWEPVPLHLCHHCEEDKPSLARWSQDEAEGHGEQSPVTEATGEATCPDQWIAVKFQTGESSQDQWSHLADPPLIPKVGIYMLTGVYTGFL